LSKIYPPNPVEMRSLFLLAICVASCFGLDGFTEKTHKDGECVMDEDCALLCPVPAFRVVEGCRVVSREREGECPKHEVECEATTLEPMSEPKYHVYPTLPTTEARHMDGECVMDEDCEMLCPYPAFRLMEGCRVVTTEREGECPKHDIECETTTMEPMSEPELICATPAVTEGCELETVEREAGKCPEYKVVCGDLTAPPPVTEKLLCPRPLLMPRDGCIKVTNKGKPGECPNYSMECDGELECPKNERVNNCGNHCEKRCSDNGEPRICTEDCRTPACECEIGYSRNNKGRCIQDENCLNCPEPAFQLKHGCTVVTTQRKGQCPKYNVECDKNSSDSPTTAGLICPVPDVIDGCELETTEGQQGACPDYKVLCEDPTLSPPTPTTETLMCPMPAMSAKDGCEIVTTNGKAGECPSYAVECDLEQELECPANEQANKCGNHCEKKCSDNGKSVTCSPYCEKAACQCAQGYSRNNKGKCVLDVYCTLDCPMPKFRLEKGCQVVTKQGTPGTCPTWDVECDADKTTVPVFPTSTQSFGTTRSGQENVNECELGESNCAAEEYCADEDEGYSCFCKDGFSRNMDTMLCGAIECRCPSAQQGSSMMPNLNAVQF
jgi:hypothetical protein